MTLYTFHQSWLAEYQLCPERARRQWFGIDPNGPTDATAIGTAVHASIEALLRGTPEAEARQIGYDAFIEETNDPHYRWVQVKTTKTAMRYIDQSWDNWLERIYPHIGQALWLEREFDLPLCTVGEHEVRLAGTADFADELGIWDWKTGKGDLKKYDGAFGGDGWKLKRFGIQPTVYCWAARQLGEIPEPNRFTFAAVAKDGWHHQVLECERSEQDDAWLAQLVSNAVLMLESSLPEWPKNDQHALCSEQWCPAWADCKGSSEGVQQVVQVVTARD